MKMLMLSLSDGGPIYINSDHIETIENVYDYVSRNEQFIARYSNMAPMRGIPVGTVSVVIMTSGSVFDVFENTDTIVRMIE